MSVKETLKAQFANYFKKAPNYYAVSPGRVNIIGEHTDYNDGFVLPVALQFSTKVMAAKRDDDLIRVRSMQYPEDIEEFKVTELIQQGQLAWGNYIRGVAKEFVDNNMPIPGCDILLTSDVPQGCGLSSSAALEVAIGGLFNMLGKHQLSNQAIAKIGQAAENNFINCQCGIMDQLISAEAISQHAVLIDCRDLSTQAVSIPDSQVVLVINSNYPRKLADSEYNDRREACETAALKMKVATLREASLDMLENVKNELDELIYKRAKHVITENARVLSSIEALQNSDLETFYSIMKEAHQSLVDDFEITVDATEGLVDICMQAAKGKAGVRQTGGGFGGAIVCVCDSQRVEDISEAVNKYYPEKYNLNADIYVCQASDGLKVTHI